MTSPARQLRAFTLIELILVMVIISIALAFAAPTLRGWGQGQKLRNATDQFIAATGYARSQAVTNASMYAVEINSSENTFAVKAVDAMGVRTDAPGEPGRVTTLPESFKITLISGGGVTAGGDAATAAGGQVLLFYPDARATPAVIQIESPTGEISKIESQAPAEPFRKVDIKS